MKRRERRKKDGNVILFPDLEKRLLEKGLETLQSKDFREAIALFEEARKLDPGNSDIYIGLVLAYYEAGFLKEAKEIANEMLKEGIGDYFQTVDLYLMILVQLHEYEEIVTTIEVLLEEREIPVEKVEHFSRMLDFSRRMVDGKDVDETRIPEDTPEPENHSHILQLFKSNDPKEQMLAIAQLANLNIMPYLEEIILYLLSPEGHPFLKTMLVNVLKEHGYDKEVSIEKFGWSKVVNPSDLFDIHANIQLNVIKKEIGNQLENDNPILFEHTVSLIERQLFLIYPFDLSPNDSKIWSAAYHFIALEYFGIEESIENISKIYKVNEEEVGNACSFIRKIEEISYPII